MQEPAYPQLAKELKQMRDADQEARVRFASATPEEIASYQEMDRRHTERLREVVKEIGWPTASLVGTEGAHHAWLLVQHADHDLAFQEHCLELMRTAAPDEVSQADVAFLTDRILCAKGKPQEYGTQYYRETPDDLFMLRPVRNPEHLDERRAAMGLESMTEQDAAMLRRQRA